MVHLDVKTVAGCPTHRKGSEQAKQTESAKNTATSASLPTPHARHNGKVERYQRILGKGFIYAHAWTSEQHRTDALQVRNVHYNHHRPHTAAAGNRLPAARLHTGVTNVMGSYTA